MSIDPGMTQTGQDETGPGKLQPRHIGGFVAVGAFAFLVDAAVLLAGMALGLGAAAARVPSFLAAAGTTWYLNRTFTFQTKSRASLGEFFGYLGAMALGLAVNYGTFVLVIYASDLASEMPVLALVPATLAGMALNFLTSRRILAR